MMTGLVDAATDKAPVLALMGQVAQAFLGSEYLQEIDEIEIFNPDKIKQLTETPIGTEGMKVDRKLFEKAKEEIQKDEEVRQAVDQEQWEKAVKILRDKYEDKPEYYE